MLGQIVRKVFAGRADKPVAVTGEMLAVERKARARASALALSEGFARALQELEPVMDGASEAATFVVFGRLKLILGHLEEAQAWLHKAEARNDSDADTLHSLAQLYGHLDDPDRQYDYARRRLECGQPFGTASFLPAARALAALVAGDAAAAGAAGSEAWHDDIQWLHGQWPQVTPAPDAAAAQEYAEYLFAMGRRAQAQAMLADLVAGLRAEQCTEMDFARMEVLQDEGRLTVIRAPDDALLRAAVIADAAVFPEIQWLPWLPDRGAVLADLATRKQRTVREVASSPLLLHDKHRAWIRLPDGQPRVIEQPAVLLGSISNYYHHVVDHLSRLAVVDALGLDVSDAVFVVGQDLLPFQAELFELLGIAPGRLLRVGPHDHLRFRQLTAPCPPLLGGVAFSPRIAAWARERLVVARGVQGPPVRLYVSRARASVRRVVNEAQLTDWLAAEGYTVIHPEDMTVAQQIDLYARASHVVAPGGAALTNMIFMPPGSRVVMLNNAHLTQVGQKRFFDPLSRACGLDFRIVSGQPAKLNTQRILDADLDVPLAKLQQTLRDWPAP